MPPEDLRKKIERLAPTKPNRDSRVNVVGPMPKFKVPRPQVRQETLTDAVVPPPGRGNVGRGGPPPLPTQRKTPVQLYSEPPSDPVSDFQESEPPTQPETPDANRISREDLAAWVAYEARRHLPVEKTLPPPPQRSVSPAGGTKVVKNEFGLDEPTRGWLGSTAKVLIALLAGGGIATGTVVAKDATDAPSATEAAWTKEEKKAVLQGLKTLTTRSKQTDKDWREQDRKMAQWLSGVLPPLGVKVDMPMDAEPVEPVKLLPPPSPDPHRVKGKGAKPVQPPPIPLPAMPPDESTE